MRCETSLLTVVGLSHAKDMTRCATLGVPDDHQSTSKQPIADDTCLAIVLPLVFDLGGQSIEDQHCVIKVQPSTCQCYLAFGWIVGYAHSISVYTIKAFGKSRRQDRVL